MFSRLRDVFACFARHDVHYLIIGGIAAVLHGVPRATFDLDVLVEATEDNVAKLLRALEDAGFGTAALVDPHEVLSNEITIFKDRVRIDVFTSVPGIGFHEAWARRETKSFQGQDLFVTSKLDLVRSKRAAGRDRDLEDVRLLELDPDQPG